MKRTFRSLVASVAVVGSAFALATSAFAGTASTQFGASATVLSDCKISNNGDIGLGNYNPVTTNASANTAVASTTISVTCTNGDTGVTIGLASGNGSNGTFVLKNGAHTLNYGLYSDNAATAAWNSTTTVAATADTVISQVDKVQPTLVATAIQ
jgi:spore coat protein U-like protein